MVPTAPTAAAWQLQTDQWLASMYCPTTDFPSGVLTVMSKSAIETSAPAGFLAVLRVFESNTLSQTAPQEPMGCGTDGGVRVTVQDP